MFIDCEAFNRGDYGKTADLVEQYLSKGKQVYLEGRLVLDQWDDKNTGQKRSKHKLVVEVMQFLDGGRQGEGEGESGSRPMARASAPASRPQAYQPADAEPTGGGDEIPF